MRVRTYDVITPGAQALWNHDELYIFVEQNKVAWSQSIWSFSWSAGQRALGIQSGVQLLLPRGTADHSVLLGDTQFVMRVTHTDDGTTRVELINSSEPKPVRVLYDFKDKTGFLSAREYKGLTE